MAETLGRDVGELYATIFNHSARCEREARFVLSELENRRSDREVHNLNLSIDTISKLDSEFATLNLRLMQEQLPAVQTQLTVAIQTAEQIKNTTTQLELQREAARKQRELQRDQSKEQLLRLLSDKRVAAENDLSQALKKAQEQFAVPEDQTTAQSSDVPQKTEAVPSNMPEPETVITTDTPASS